MPRPFDQRLQRLVDDFRERGVIRAAIVYGTFGATSLGILDLIRDLIPWLDRAFPVLVLGTVFAFPVVLILSWVFDRGPDGIRLHHDPGAEKASFGYRMGAGAGVAMASVVFAWTILTLWDRSEARPAPPGLTPALDPTRIAVLYFDDHSPGGDLGFLANGITEDLTNRLANVEALEVASRNGVKAFRENPPGVRELAERLNAGTLVEGSITGESGQVRVTVQLIDARSDEHLMSRQFDADRGELLALQDELSEAIAIALREHLGMSIREEEGRARAANMEAWTAYHEASATYDQAVAVSRQMRRGAATGLFRRADSLLAVAEAADPSWPDPPVLRGWVAMSASMDRSDAIGYVQPQDSAALMAVAQRAVQVSGGSPAALELRGVTTFEIAEALGDATLRRRAESDLRSALEKEPDRARALAHLSDIRRIAGDFGSARLYAEQALAADAFLEDVDRVVYRLFNANLELRDWDEADKWCAMGRRNHPSDNGFVLCRLFLITLRPGPKDPDEAWAVLDTLRVLSGPEDWELQYRTWAGFQVARVLALNGLPDSAEAVVAAYRSSPEDRPWFAYDEASVRLALGDRSGALDLLELYLTVAPDRARYLAQDWLFEGLRGDPRFDEMTGAP